MRRSLPLRFWFEAAVGAVGTILFVLTLVTREWIEALTGWDPDGGSGALEILIATSLLAIATISILAARRTHRHAALTG